MKVSQHNSSCNKWCHLLQLVKGTVLFGHKIKVLHDLETKNTTQIVKALLWSFYHSCMFKSEQNTFHYYTVFTVCFQLEPVCSRFYLQKNDYVLRTSKGDKWLLVKPTPGTQTANFHRNFLYQSWNHGFPLIKIQTNSNHSQKRKTKKAFQCTNISYRSCISFVSNTLCRTSVVNQMTLQMILWVT